jgi:hypothetical protein
MYRGQTRAGGPGDGAAGGAPGAPPAEQPLCKPAAPEDNLSRGERAALAPSLYKADATVGAMEAWQRLNNDPMLMIKKQEQESLKKIKANPIKMQEIWSEVRSLCFYRTAVRDGPAQQSSACGGLDYGEGGEAFAGCSQPCSPQPVAAAATADDARRPPLALLWRLL